MTSSLRLYVLNDNESGEGLLNSWGWSVFLDLGGQKILFDTGPSPQIIEYNSSRMGISLEDLDFVFISHHHHDHVGGLPYIGKVAPSVTVYVPPGEISYVREVGLNPIVIRKPQMLSEEVWSTGPLKSWFIEEQALAVKIDGKGVVIIVGCSHPGIVKILEPVSQK